jgi:hypothetical protein
VLDAVWRRGAVSVDPTGSRPAPRPFVDGQSWPVLARTHQAIYDTCREALGA